MNRIKDLREARGWTQTQLGRKVGVERTAISNYEREDRQLSAGIICRFCDLFDVSADFLLGRSSGQKNDLDPSDAELLRIYHALPLEIRRAVDGLMAPYRHDETKEKTGS